MKLCRLISIVILATLAFSACKDHEHDLYDGSADNFRFPERAFSVSESATSPLQIPILFSKLEKREGTVTVSITGGTENVDYQVLSPSLTFTFAADQYSDTLEILPIDNAVENDPVFLELELSSTESIGWSGDTLSQNCIVRINDNDGCPSYDIAIFSGTFQGTNANGQSGLGGLDPTNGPITSVMTPSGGTVSITNIGGIDDSFTGGGFAAPDPATLTLSGGQQGTVTVSGATGYTLQSGGTIDFGGSGTYDICAGEMIVDWNLANGSTGDLLFLGTATYALQ